jgi:hypothetical protein
LTGSAVALTLLVVPATAATSTPAVTLAATPTTLKFGLSTTAYGHVTPRQRGQTVTLMDQNGHVLARPTTNAEGRYKASFVPRKTIWLHAQWKGAKSPAVRIRVRAVVTVGLGHVLLFGNAVAWGKVRPINPGARVEVVLVRGNTPVARQFVPMGRRGKFKTRFYVPMPGTYRARAIFDDDEHLPGKARSGASTTPMPSLQAGSRGEVVFLLERRLVALHYRLAGVDRRFDFRTADAVLAFRKVQGLARINTVDSKVWHKLAFPRHPKVRLKTKGRHIEVNQSLQVLMVVVDGKIAYILHVSTGKPSTPTPDGSFRVWRKLAGFSGHHLYYPSYFDGRRAIHGWTEVPPYAASHGCVRIPYWNAIWMFGLDPIGTRVLVYH